MFAKKQDDDADDKKAKPAAAKAESDKTDPPPGVPPVGQDPPPPKHKVREKAGEEPKPKDAKHRRPASADVPDDKPLQHALRKEGRLFRVSHPGGVQKLVEADDAEEAVECYVASYTEADEKKPKLSADDKRTADVVAATVAGLGLGQTKVEITKEGCSAFKLPE